MLIIVERSEPALRKQVLRHAVANGSQTALYYHTCL